MEDETNNNLGKELLDLIKLRRSVRQFDGRKIPREKILSIIESGIWAPTGCNNQELRFLVIDKEEKISEIIKFKPFFKGVAAVVLIFCDMSLPMSRKIYRKKKASRHLCYIDTGLALTNMVNFAKNIGIDSCIFNLSEYHRKEEKKKSRIKKFINKIKIKLNLHATIEENFEFFLRKNLEIPGHLKIMCGVVFGFADKYPDVTSEMHGGKRILREKVERYMVKE
ncbi:MAG: nitroreductase family protein [Candidatus Omnitrophota bacterium]